MRGLTARSLTAGAGALRTAGSAAKTAMTNDATMAAIPAFLATMALEHVALRRNKTALVAIGDPTTASNVEAPLGYELKDTLASLNMGAGMLGIGLAAEKVLGPLDHAVHARRVTTVGTGALGFAAAIVVWDFAYYWSHRWQHEHRMFWAAHVNHHSSERYNLSTALRQPWTSAIMHWVYLPMIAAGFSPAQVSRAGQVNLLYQYWVHTEVIDRLPDSAEKVLNTASHHRVHHGVNPQYLDRNYAGIFIVWDRLFRSFEPERERVRYGLTKNIRTFNPVKIAFHEWRDIVRDVRSSSSWRDRVGFALQHPGWQPAA